MVPVLSVAAPKNISVKQTVNLVKLGVNYKFDWAAAPIVAKD
jgi:hypothetical protein